MKKPFFSVPRTLILHALTTFLIGVGCVWPLSLSLGLTAPLEECVVCCGAVTLLFALLDCLPRLRALAYPLLLAGISGVAFAMRGQFAAVGAALAVCEPAAPRRVLVAHQMVVSGVCPPQLSGSETAPLTVGTVDSIDAARFAGFCYAALGHIHRAQRVGIDAVRYAGSPLCYHLDECGAQKSVTLVRIGKRGVEKIEPLPLTPRRAMRHLTGPLAKLVEHPTDTEDYIWATLTDPTPLPDAMAQLRAAYPNAMRLDYQPQDAAALPADMTQAVRGKPFAELFQDFFTKMNGRPLTTEEVLAVKKLREEASKIE